ncbi:vinorine synthase-like protein [Tanacetum coccineum]
MVMWRSLFKTGKCRTTRIVFDSSKLAALKAAVAANGVKDPTRVEVVSALLWKCVMDATEEKNGSWKPSLLSHVVNLRKRLVSTLSENTIGNLIWLASAECKTSSKTRLCVLVEKVRGSVSKINSEFVKKLQADFGWGKPIWACGGGVCHGSPVFMNFVVLMDTKYGDGIEAWVNMDEYEMHVIKHNPELLEFASIDPSPLQMN